MILRRMQKFSKDLRDWTPDQRRILFWALISSKKMLKKLKFRIYKNLKMASSKTTVGPEKLRKVMMKGGIKRCGRGRLEKHIFRLFQLVSTQTSLLEADSLEEMSTSLRKLTKTNKEWQQVELKLSVIVQILNKKKSHKKSSMK